MKIIVKTDGRKRITLPAETHVEPGDIVKMDVLATGQIQLTPVVMVPKSKIKAAVFADTNQLVRIIVE